MVYFKLSVLPKLLSTGTMEKIKRSLKQNNLLPWLESNPELPNTKKECYPLILGFHFTVVGANGDPLKVIGKAVTVEGGVADKKAFSVHTKNIICQRQYFVAGCLCFFVNNTFDLHSRIHGFEFPYARKVGTTHRFPQTIVPLVLLVYLNKTFRRAGHLTRSTGCKSL